jgi:hypothetical protein
MTLKPDKEPFLTRWSKRKHEAREEEAREKPEPEASAAQQPAAEKTGDGRSSRPELPPIEKLDYDSDYRAFLDPRVDEETRRSALKKLFADARFNEMDGLDVYIDDYTKSDPIPAAALASLQQARNILEWAKSEDGESVRQSGDATAEQSPQGEIPAPEDGHPAPAGAGVPLRTAGEGRGQGAETAPSESGKDVSRRDS